MFKIIWNKLCPNYVCPLMALLLTFDSMYLSCAAI